jgi:hypothetical protein
MTAWLIPRASDALRKPPNRATASKARSAANGGSVLSPGRRKLSSFRAVFCPDETGLTIGQSLGHAKTAALGRISIYHDPTAYLDDSLNRFRWLRFHGRRCQVLWRRLRPVLRFKDRVATIDHGFRGPHAAGVTAKEVMRRTDSLGARRIRDGDTPNRFLNRRLKWEEQLKPKENAISVIVARGSTGYRRACWHDSRRAVQTYSMNVWSPFEKNSCKYLFE